MADFSLAEARRIALRAQGFDKPRPSGRINSQHIRAIIRRLSLVQLDFVNVLVPAHYQVFFSRLGPYDRSILDRLIYQQREFTEQWAHEASIVPMKSWPLLRNRRETHRVRPWGFEEYLSQHSSYVEWVLEQIRERGPLTAEELPTPENGPRRVPNSWFGSVPRAVLEAHFGRGLLAIADRLPSFARAYDMSERVIPAEHHETRISREDAERELIRLSAIGLGIATAADLADYYRMPVASALPRVRELVDSGIIREVRVEGWRGSAYLHRDARVPRRIIAAALISPFDPLIWFRSRTERLFGFHYRFEIFVPQEKRKWGVYVLPFLLGDRLVARVDLKADRTAGKLRVVAIHLEPGADRVQVAEALNVELAQMAEWLGLDPPPASSASIIVSSS